MGARGLPARLGLARALPARQRRAGRAGAAEADGGCAPRSARERGKSDAIDALAVARAALREPALPAARSGRAASARSGLLRRPPRGSRRRADAGAASAALAPARARRRSWSCRPAALDRRVWLDRIARRLARREQTTQVRICRELVAPDRGADPARDASSSASLRSLVARAGASPARAARLRPPHRRQAGRRDRRRRSLRRRGAARDARRRRPASGLERQAPTPPAQPLRQPPAQLRPAPHRRHARAAATHPHAPTSPASRRKARTAKRRSAASSATSRAPSTARSQRSQRRR